MNGKEIRFSFDHPGKETRERKIREYLDDEYVRCSAMKESELAATLVSAANWKERRVFASCLQWGLWIRPGDVCFLDFGRGYLMEAGYQHFGLIISICQGKAFIIPMTSNPETYEKAYHPQMNPKGKKNLYAIGQLEGLNKKSVLFLNDAKYLNTARIIDVKAHIPTQGSLYKDIIEHLRECIQI